MESQPSELPSKAVILAGGFGTRLSELTEAIPKPMVEVGGKPLLWHLMKFYSSYGVNDFIICVGYRGYVIKEYFNNYFVHMSDVTFDFMKNSKEIQEMHADPWRVTVVDTGELTMTGGRLKQIAKYLHGENEFFMTYGDGLSDVDLSALVKLHRREKRLATVTAVRPPARFGAIASQGSKVTGFVEKPDGDGARINGGFFVLSPKSLELIESPETSWESDTLPHLAQADELSLYEHNGFWQPMDTLRDHRSIQSMWERGERPWLR